MARATYTEIATVILEKQTGWKKKDKFIVIPPEQADMALTVYPPTSYNQDYGIDVYLSDNTAELWLDGYCIRKLNSIQDATKVAEIIIEELEKSERLFNEQQ